MHIKTRMIHSAQKRIHTPANTYEIAGLIIGLLIIIVFIENYARRIR